MLLSIKNRRDIKEKEGSKYNGKKTSWKQIVGKRFLALRNKTGGDLGRSHQMKKDYKYKVLIISSNNQNQLIFSIGT